MTLVYQPELLYSNGCFVPGKAIVVEADGTVGGIEDAASIRNPDWKLVRLPGRALLPGMIDVHSHSFQRTIRGTVESRNAAGPDFWSWRDAMYRAASRYSPEELYTIARMAFLEMALVGITTVGEFHYLHRSAEGLPYDDPNEIAMRIVAAAESVGIRIALLRVAYVRAGFNKPAVLGQMRFIEPDPGEYLRNTSALRETLRRSNGMAWAGVAPHSIRAVPLDYLRTVMQWANAENLPVHMHVAEQPAENSACIEEYGCTPFALLDREGMLHERFTAIHGIHIGPKEIAAVGRANALIGACPTTERNLGDGVLPADELMGAEVRIAFGSDSLSQIDPLENARELEYNLRLKYLERAVLDGVTRGGLARQLFTCATENGAASLGAPGGSLYAGRPADFFTVDLRDASIAGSGPDELLASIVFGLSKTAIRDVAVNGQMIVEDRMHKAQEEIVEKYVALMRQGAGSR